MVIRGIVTLRRARAAIAVAVLVGFGLTSVGVTSALATEADTIAALVNQARASAGLPGLIHNPAMDSVTLRWANQMGAPAPAPGSVAAAPAPAPKAPAAPVAVAAQAPIAAAPAAPPAATPTATPSTVASAAPSAVPTPVPTTSAKDGARPPSSTASPPATPGSESVLLSASTSAAQKPFPIGYVIGGILVILGIGGGIYGQRMRIRGRKPPRT